MAVLGTVAAVATAGLVAAPPSAGAVTGHPPGVVGSPLTLDTVQSLSGYDVAANAAGTAFIGWISTTTTDPTTEVHLCRLPAGATTCTGGVQTTDALGPSASGLQVVVTATNLVHLIWFRDTPNSINGPQGSAIAEATAQGGLNLTAAHDVVTDAPSFGELLTADRGPNGSIWTVSYAGLPTQSVQVRDDLTAAAVSVPTPFAVGFAQLAFAGGKPVLAVEEDGAIRESPHYATRSSGGTWSSFHPVAHTWAVGTNAGMATTQHGLRLVSGVDNASHRPVIARWTGSGFSPRQLTADHNACPPSTHDGNADPSGRFLDVSWECDDVTVTNYADALHAGIVRFGVTDPSTSAPQIASGTPGIATVVYSTQSGTGQVLDAAHVRLPDGTRTVTNTDVGGVVTVTGPLSCLPPVNVHIGWTHQAASGWTFRSGSLRLNGNVISTTTLDGATLDAGTDYTLLGNAVFANGADRNTVKASLDFQTCANA